MSNLSDINDFIAAVEKESPFVKFEDGEPVEGLYKGTKTVEDTFNKGEETLEHTIEVDGVEKSFKSRSIKLARLLSKIKKDDKIQVVKTGQAFDTLWYVKEV